MSLMIFLLVFSCIQFVKSDISELSHLNFTQIAQKNGLKCEEFDVVTEDNYILKMFHIIGDKTKPILLGHGLIDTSEVFIMRGKSSLAIFLADLGYDVWALNVRGSKYGRRHATLNPDTDKAFWDFTFHEMGVGDLPANIDFVLNKTNQTKLVYIGHSQGTQMSFVLGSVKPEYNDKMKVHIALAPIAFLHNFPMPLSLLPYLWPAVNTNMLAMGQEELTFPQSFRSMCAEKEIGYELCAKGLVFTFTGSDQDEFEPEFSTVYFGHYPATTSRKNMDHLVQIVMRKKFAFFDYGMMNLLVYGTPEPPDYPLSKITTPVVLVVGQNDKLSDIKDVNILRAQLPQAYYYEVNHKNMNHVDFTIGKHMNHYLFPVLKYTLRKFLEL